MQIGNCGQWSGQNLRDRVADGVIGMIRGICLVFRFVLVFFLFLGVMAGKGANNVQPSWEKIPITGA